jgi:hypothetical protein
MDAKSSIDPRTLLLAVVLIVAFTSFRRSSRFECNGD